MDIKIICDEIACIHNSLHDLTHPNVKEFPKGIEILDFHCKNPDGVVISMKKGCQSSTIEIIKDVCIKEEVLLKEHSETHKCFVNSGLPQHPRFKTKKK